VVASFKRDSFDFSIDEEGDQEIDTDFVTVEFNWDVGFGDGTVTDFASYRDLKPQPHCVPV
jgi:iron complex outermembrane receptor protein